MLYKIPLLLPDEAFFIQDLAVLKKSVLILLPNGTFCKSAKFKVKFPSGNAKGFFAKHFGDVVRQTDNFEQVKNSLLECRFANVRQLSIVSIAFERLFEIGVQVELPSILLSHQLLILVLQC